MTAIFASFVRDSCDSSVVVNKYDVTVHMQHKTTANETQIYNH